jgi:O-antigen/teichoic acid export membrane protein
VESEQVSPDRAENRDPANASARLLIVMRPSAATYLEMFAARCVAMIGPVGVAIITARSLGPEGQGRYYYVVMLATIAAQVASLGIHASNTYLISQQASLLPAILSNTAWIAIVGGVAAAFAAVVFDSAIEGSLGLQASVLFVVLLCPLTLLFIYLSNLAIAINRLSLFNGLIIFSSVVSLVAIVGAAFIAPTINVFLGALVASSFLACIVSWNRVAQGCDVSWRFDFALFRKGMMFAARAHIAALVGFGMARTSAIVLRHHEAFADLGHWSIAAQIADALLLLPATISLLLFPALVKADTKQRWSEFKLMTLKVSAVMAILCLVVAGIVFPLIEVVFGAAYAPAGRIALALLPGVFFLAIASIASQFLSAFGIPLSQLAGWIVGWALQILLSLLLFEKYGALGLACVQSGCAAFVCLWLFIKALAFAPGRNHVSAIR